MSSNFEERPNRWLSAHAKKYHSQAGEDGIVEQILSLLPAADRWCVEFGAWDGVHLSNTCYFITRKEYGAVLIEGDPTRFRTLELNYTGNPRVHALNRLVGFTAADGLDALLAATPAPCGFDLLSIDIDGNDYHAWAAVTRYQPKVVVIEYNPTIPDAVSFVQEPDPEVMHGSSILSLCNLGKSKGYELAAVTFCNLIFVDARYFPLLGIRDNSIAELRADRSALTYLFQGYDGTVFLRGAPGLHWHGIPFSPATFQPLPALLRKYPDNYSAEERQLFTLYRELYWRMARKDPTVLRQLPLLDKENREIALDPEEVTLWNSICAAMRQFLPPSAV